MSVWTVRFGTDPLPPEGTCYHTILSSFTMSIYTIFTLKMLTFSHNLHRHNIITAQKNVTRGKKIILLKFNKVCVQNKKFCPFENKTKFERYINKSSNISEMLNVQLNLS